MNDKEKYNPDHFIELIDQLKQMVLLFKGIKDKNIVRRFGKHDVFVRGELHDLDVIWKRFLKNRKELIDLGPLSTKYLHGEKDNDTEEAGRVFAREAKLRKELKVDLKSLFLFTDILFNKTILLVRAVVNPKRGIEYRSYTSFIKSLRKLDGNDKESIWEYSLYQKFGENLERIDVLLGFYRDKFIVHVSGPYQEGLAYSVYFPEIRLDHTSWKLDKFDLNKFMELVKEIGDIIPKKDKFGRPMDQESDPRPKVESLFVNLHLIKDPKLRERAEGYIRSIGLSTPDIYYLLKTIKDTMTDIVMLLSDYINKNYVKK